MNSSWAGPLPLMPFTVIAFALGAVLLLLARWFFVRSLWRGRRRAHDGADEPDRVWSVRDGGPWILTFRGQVYEVWSEDLPKGRELPRGLMSDEVFGMLARSKITEEDFLHRMRRFDPGDLIAARLVHNTSDPDAVPWRIDALEREKAHRVLGFDDERDANNVLELLRRRVLLSESAALHGAAADDAIEAARRRDEGEDTATERPSRQPAGSHGTRGA